MSTLQELLNLGLVAIGSDDSRFAKMEAAGAALVKHLLSNPALVIPATLIAIDCDADENDPFLTTLLAFLYMWLLEHGEVPGWVFAGSWTLGAWESLVEPSRWTAEPPPSFPPHTSSSGRIPGLLHLTLRNKKGLVRDVLFTDAPGEWFTMWAKAPDHEGAGGARWVIEHANVILLLVDSGALSNEKTLPQARRATRDLTERVGALASHVPLGFTWTKTDVAPSVATRETIERARSQFAPTSEIWETTTKTPSTIAKILSQAIDLGANQPGLQKLHEPRLDDEPFLAFRGNYVCG